MMVDVVVSWLSSDVEPCTSLSMPFVQLMVAPAGATVGASPASPVLSGKGRGTTGGRVDGEICSVGWLVVAQPPQGSSGGLCSASPDLVAASAGARGSWEAIGSPDPSGLAEEAALGGPGRVGLGLGCFLAVFTCFSVGGFFLTGKVCFASASGAAVGVGRMWVRTSSVVSSAAGSAPSSAAGSRLRAVECPSSLPPLAEPMACLSSPALPTVLSTSSSAARGSGLAGTSAAPDPLSAKKWGKVGLGQFWA